MIWVWVAIYVLMGMPNGVLTVVQSTPEHLKSLPTMVFRVFLGCFTVVIWPVAALKVYYTRMFGFWRHLGENPEEIYVEPL